MKPPPGCRRLSPLGAALGAFITLSFTLGLLGGPFRHRAPPSPPCRPRSHLVFLKTHKTGGSSVLNLLARFGEARRLRFALPRRYQFGYPAAFRAERVRGFGPGAGKFDIICHHMRFNLSEVQRVMPNDSFYFSIVRDPALAAESAFSYFRAAAPAFRSAPSLGAFLAAPWRYFRAGLRGNHYARNLQWFDFGLPEPAHPAQVPALLAELGRVFPAGAAGRALRRVAGAAAAPPVLAAGRRGSVPSQLARLLRPEPLGRAAAAAAGVELAGLGALLALQPQLLAGGRALRAGAAAERGGRAAAAPRGPGRRCLRGGGPVPAAEIAERGLRPFQPPGAGAILGFALRPGLRGEERELCRRLAMPELPYKDLLDRLQFGDKTNSSG